MKKIAENLQLVQSRIDSAAASCQRNSSEIRLLAVSKTKPAALVREALTCGQREFAENYLQDALPKIGELADESLVWHYIGQIQSNKTRDIAAHFDWVHSIDRLKIGQRLSAQRGPDQKPLQCCIQINVSGEVQKGGVEPDQLMKLAAALAELPRLQLRGLMVIGSNTKDNDITRSEFERARTLFEAMQTQYPSVDTLSMGMSADLEAAIVCGSTMVRIGTDIFGARQ